MSKLLQTSRHAFIALIALFFLASCTPVEYDELSPKVKEDAKQVIKEAITEANEPQLPEEAKSTWSGIEREKYTDFGYAQLIIENITDSELIEQLNRTARRYSAMNGYPNGTQINFFQHTTYLAFGSYHVKRQWVLKVLKSDGRKSIITNGEWDSDAGQISRGADRGYFEEWMGKPVPPYLSIKIIVIDDDIYFIDSHPICTKDWLSEIVSCDYIYEFYHLTII